MPLVVEARFVAIFEERGHTETSCERVVARRPSQMFGVGVG